MRPRPIIAFALAALIAAGAAEAAADEVPAGDAQDGGDYRALFPWFLGISVASEGFGGDLGLPDAERLSLALVLDPFTWKNMVPSLAAGVSIPVYPWLPAETLFEARLDLRLLTIRPKLLESLYDGPAEYAPALTVSVYVPFNGDDAFASFGVRPFAFRTGDAVYSFLSPSTVMSRGSDPGAAYNFRGYSIELFEFTHYYW